MNILVPEPIPLASGMEYAAGPIPRSGSRSVQPIPSDWKGQGLVGMEMEAVMAVYRCLLTICK